MSTKQSKQSKCHHKTFTSEDLNFKGQNYKRNVCDKCGVELKTVKIVDSDVTE